MVLPRGAATADTLADDDLESIFGIDLEDGGPPTARKRPGPLALHPRSRQALAALRAELERQDE